MFRSIAGTPSHTPVFDLGDECLRRADRLRGPVASSRGGASQLANRKPLRAALIYRIGPPTSTSRFDQSRGIIMREVQASEAKTHLPRLLDDVERGETVIITRHGRAIARLVPEPHRRQEEVDSAIKNIRALRKRAGRITVAEL